MTTKPTAEVSVEDKALIEEFMWQTKQDQHNICGQYNPTFCDKVEKRLTQLLHSHTTALKAKVVEVVKENVPLERIPSDYTTTKKAIDALMKLHYEPEHEEGQTCWCLPTTTVNPKTKKVYIDHKEQRTILRRFVEENFVSKEQAISNLGLGSNQARRGILNALKAITNIT